ncbi:ribonuclease H [Senna tora]|uniref:Ribonuclease H n=1 Tax=Senna tora TaxID=362788 RepID=A0A834T0C5_9FABA|nr:ribonuclease H [Senna tora]
MKVSRQSPRINHLFFADDSMLFFKADIESCISVSNIWRDFGSYSGLIMNLDKTEIKFSPNTPRRFQKLLSETLQCRVTDKFSKYLGAKIDNSAHDKVQFQMIYANLQEKLQSWKGKLLSKAGRLTLIKSVLTSMSLCHLNYYKLTKAEAMKCDSILAHFFWGSDRQRNKPHMLNWEAICKPMNLGGLGVKSFSEFNQALLAKQFWRILVHQNTLLSVIMKAKYATSESPVGFKCPRTASKQWKDIFSAKDVVLNHIKWQVGTGHSIPLNSAHWPTPTNNVENQPNRVSDLIDTTCRWNRELVCQLYDAETAGMILKTPISITQGEDKLYWNGNNEGIFKVKDGYKKLTESRQLSLNRNQFKPWKDYWKINLPAKVLMFGWKLCHDRLPIAENLLKKNYNIEGNCVFGCELKETQNHLFMDCPAAKAVWSIWVDEFDKKDLLIHILVTCWSIYKSRNEILFQQKSILPDHIISLCKEVQMVWKLGVCKDDIRDMVCNRKFRDHYTQARESQHADSLRVYIVYQNDRRGKKRIWGSYYNTPNGHCVSIVGMVAPSEEQLQGTMLKGIRETLQMLRNYQRSHVAIFMENKNLTSKMNNHAEFGNCWGTIARDIDTMRLDFAYFECFFMDYIDKTPLNYLRGAQVGIYYNLQGL